MASDLRGMFHHKQKYLIPALCRLSSFLAPAYRHPLVIIPFVEPNFIRFFQKALALRDENTASGILCAILSKLARKIDR